MKNKKGFTLIEVIVCIILIMAIGVMTFITGKKSDIDDERIDVLYTSANVLLETSNEYKNAFLDEEIVYIKIGDLISQGLIDEKEYLDYKDKCVKITNDEQEITQCVTLAKLKVENFVKNVCYLNEDDLPTIKFSVDLVDDENNKFISVIISSNGVVKKEIKELKSLYSYKVEDNDKNLKIVLNYKNAENENKQVVWNDDGEYLLTKIPVLTYINNELSISNNNVDLSYSLDDSNYIATNLIDMNNKINTYNQDLYLKVNGTCIEEKKYKLNYGYNLNKSGISRSNIMFGIGDNPGGECSNGSFVQRPLYYFRDGSFLYEYSYYYKNSNCGIARGTWIYFVDPVKNIKTQLLYLPGQSSNGWSFDVKIVKSSESIFYLYTKQNQGYADYCRSCAGNYYSKYSYGKYKYDHENNSLTLLKMITPYTDFYNSCRSLIEKAKTFGENWYSRCTNNKYFKDNHNLYVVGNYGDITDTYATITATSSLNEYNDSDNILIKNLICNYSVASYMEQEEIIWTYSMDRYSCEKIWEDDNNYYVMYYFNTIMANGYHKWHNIVKFPKNLVNKFTISSL